MNVNALIYPPIGTLYIWLDNALHRIKHKDYGMASSDQLETIKYASAVMKEIISRLDSEVEY